MAPLGRQRSRLAHSRHGLRGQPCGLGDRSLEGVGSGRHALVVVGHDELAGLSAGAFTLVGRARVRHALLFICLYIDVHVRCARAWGCQTGARCHNSRDETGGRRHLKVAVQRCCAAPPERRKLIVWCGCRSERERRRLEGEWAAVATRPAREGLRSPVSQMRVRRAPCAGRN